MDPNETLSHFDSENKTESPITLQLLMEQMKNHKKAKAQSFKTFVIVSVLVITINIFGITLLMSSESKEVPKTSTQENDWQSIYSTLLINQNPS